MTLGEMQRIFSKNIASLILWAYENGYEITLGDAYRDPRVFGYIGTLKGYGHPHSNHKRRLALDLNLFKNGVYLDRTEDHAAVGKKWKSMHPLNRWGGDFKDGNHYSMTYRGAK